MLNESWRYFSSFIESTKDCPDNQGENQKENVTKVKTKRRTNTTETFLSGIRHFFDLESLEKFSRNLLQIRIIPIGLSRRPRARAPLAIVYTHNEWLYAIYYDATFPFYFASNARPRRIDFLASLRGPNQDLS